MELCNRLKGVRLEKQLTQETLAVRIGVTRQTIIAIEREKFVPSVRLALELAHALEIPIGDLFWLDSASRRK